MLISAEIKQHLSEPYLHIEQIPDEKVLKIEGEITSSVRHSSSCLGFTITTNKNIYKSKMIVIGISPANTFAIEGLKHYVELHQKSLAEKQRIQLKNIDHKVTDGLYLTGKLS